MKARRLLRRRAGLRCMSSACPRRSRIGVEERKGPRVGAPEAAIQGFLKSAGLARIEDAKIVSDGKKGEFYVAHIEKPGRATREVIAEIVARTCCAAFPGRNRCAGARPRSRSDALRWVRPLRSILCTFGRPARDAGDVAFRARRPGRGRHRPMAIASWRPAPIKVRRFEDYVDASAKAKVVLDAERRKRDDPGRRASLAFAQGLELVEDEGLLEEVAGLVEWPVVLMGEFERNSSKSPPK